MVEQTPYPPYDVREVGMLWMIKGRPDGSLALVTDTADVAAVPFDPSPAHDLDIQTWTATELHRLFTVHKATDVPPRVPPDRIWRAVSVRRDAGKLVELSQVSGVRIADNTLPRVIASIDRRWKATQAAKLRIDKVWSGSGAVHALVSPLATLAIGHWWFKAPLTEWMYLMFFILAVGPLGLMWLMIQLYSLAFGRWQAQENWYKYIFVAVCMTAAATLTLGALRGRGTNPPALLQGLLELLFCTLLVFIIGTLSFQWKDYLIETIGRRAPIETLAYDFLYVAWMAWQVRHNLPNKRLLNAIEAAARRCERNFRALSPRQDRTLGPWSTETGHRIAETIRRHKIALTLPAVPLESVIQSLINGLEAVLAGNLEVLTRYDPPPVARTLVRRFAPRVVLAAALFTSSFAVGLILDSSMASDVRKLLWFASLTVLVSPDLKKSAESVLTKHIK